LGHCVLIQEPLYLWYLHKKKILLLLLLVVVVVVVVVVLVLVLVLVRVVVLVLRVVVVVVQLASGSEDQVYPSTDNMSIEMDLEDEVHILVEQVVTVMVPHQTADVAR
jgi:hypothetical protein